MAAIDESELGLKIRSLRVLEGNTNELLAKISNTRKVLESIETANSTDPVTGQATSAARRREVYDACMPIASELLGLEEEGEGEAAE